MSVSLAKALELVRKAVEAGEAQKCPIVAVVTDVAGNIVAAGRMDGVGHINTEVARKKALCAATFKIPTHDFVEGVSRDPLAKQVVLNDPVICPLPGGFPVMMGEQCVGALGIAGGYYLQDRAIGEYAMS
jgi:uncharacterized protein GlcG (DUF336 family)